jgi:predicted transporter
MKTRFSLSGMALPVLLAMILALAGIIGTQSWKKRVTRLSTT